MAKEFNEIVLSIKFLCSYNRCKGKGSSVDVVAVLVVMVAVVIVAVHLVAVVVMVVHTVTHLVSSKTSVLCIAC